MIEVNGKIYRNIQEQVQENMDDIEALDTRVTALEGAPEVDAYSKAQADAKFQTIAGMSTYATKSELNGKQNTLTEGAGIDIDSNNAISVDATVVPFKIDLATVAFSGSYNDLTNKLTTSDTIDIYNNEISVDPDYVVTKNGNGNVVGTLQVAHLQSEDWDEDDDCKAHAYLSSGLRRSTITLETEGEETGSSLILQGSTSVDSEGFIDLYGETRFYTKNRVKVYDTSTNPSTERTIAYLSDIPTVPTVVDTVADGNMNAVTSNAVYDIVGNIETLLAAI